MRWNQSLFRITGRRLSAVFGVSATETYTADRSLAVRVRRRGNRRSRRLWLVESLECRAMLAGTVTQVNTFETWNATPRVIKSTDPAGLTYHAPSGTLFIADSEINEISQFNNVNVFQTNLRGTQVYNEFWPGKNKEPTGIVYNEADGFFYISNDDDKTITRFDKSLSSEKGRVSTSNYNINDPEDVTADPASGLLYVVSGHPPLVAVFDSSLKYIRQFSTSSRMKDAEGIAYDRASGNLFLVSSPDQRIFEYTVQGTFVEEYRIDGLKPKPQTPQGLAFAPCSDNSAPQCLYIADGGIDNYPDGRIYEIRIGNGSTSSAPVANGQSLTTKEDTSVDITLTGSDPSGKSLTFIVDSLPSHGTLTGTGANQRYVPDADYFGPDSFRFKVSNGSVASAAATVSITVTAVNDPPVASPQEIVTGKDIPVSFVLAGSDVDGDTLNYSIVTNPVSGTLSGTAPNLTFTPKSGFVGDDSFDYQVKDPSGSSSRATVTVHVSQLGSAESISFQDKVFPTTSYDGTQDTKVRGDYPTNSYGSSSKLEIDGKPDISTLLKWDIRQVPVGSIVRSVKITINVLENSQQYFQLYQLLRPWDEKTATYIQSASGSPWDAPGAQGAGDRGTTILGEVTAPNLGVAVITLNSAGIAVVQGWVDNPSSNYGLTFQNYLDANTDDLDFSSSDNSNVLQRPKLSIDFQRATSTTSLAITNFSAPDTNPTNPYDANADGSVSSSDVRIVVNRLNQTGEAEAGGALSGFFPDISGDGLITPGDALLVINVVNQLARSEQEVDLDAEIAVTGVNGWVISVVAASSDGADGSGLSPDTGESFAGYFDSLEEEAVVQTPETESASSNNQLDLSDWLTNQEQLCECDWDELTWIE